jgi:hypothetical protein
MDNQNNWQPVHVIMKEYGWLGMSTNEMRIVLNGCGLCHEFEVIRPWASYNLNFFQDLIAALAAIDYACDVWTHNIAPDNDECVHANFFFKRSEDAIVVRTLLDFG